MSQIILPLLCFSLLCTQISMYLNSETFKREIDTLQRRISFLELRMDLQKRFTVKKE